MLNWLANALATRITRATDARLETALDELRTQHETSRREARALISEMEDMLEKFSRVVARQAMRRTRAARSVLEGELAAEEAPAGQPAAAVAAELTPEERKKMLRGKLAAGTLQIGKRASS